MPLISPQPKLTFAQFNLKNWELCLYFLFPVSQQRDLKHVQTYDVPVIIASYNLQLIIF